jgi:hypothetical protein
VSGRFLDTTAIEADSEPARVAVAAFWCQYCGARFADRNELLAHLEAEKQRDQTAPEP